MGLLQAKECYSCKETNHNYVHLVNDDITYEIYLCLGCYSIIKTTIILGKIFDKYTGNKIKDYF